MQVLEKGRIHDDDWMLVEGDDPLPAGRVIVDQARLPAAATARAAEGRPLGVRLHPDDALADLAPWLDALDLIALEMPTFHDGRTFSQARALRERHGFTGEIRVLGQPLPDQYLFLLRCGTTSVALPEDADIASWKLTGLGFSVTYQDSVRDEPLISLLRRRLAATRI